VAVCKRAVVAFVAYQLHVVKDSEPGATAKLTFFALSRSL